MEHQIDDAIVFLEDRLHLRWNRFIERVDRYNHPPASSWQAFQNLESPAAQGYDRPFSCRAGACANCASIVKVGEIDMDMQQILSDEEVNEKNVRLTCIGSPAEDEVKIVYNAKHLDYLQNRVI